MAWETPKTDWYGVTVNSVYTGDRFNAKDFNRIKNNLEYLHNLAISLYKSFTIDGVNDANYKTYLYADAINTLEQNLNTINVNTINNDYGSTPVFESNGNTMTYVELNRIESATLDIYNKLNNQKAGRRMFTWNFGMKGDF